jgi:hypothetical protein
MVKRGGVYGGRRLRNEQVQEQEAPLLAENDVAEQEAIMAGIESMFGHLNAASGWLPLYLVVFDRDWSAVPTADSARHVSLVQSR